MHVERLPSVGHQQELQEFLQEILQERKRYYYELNQLNQKPFLIEDTTLSTYTVNI